MCSSEVPIETKFNELTTSMTQPPFSSNTEVAALDIVYHDDFFIAVNKPSGLLVHKSEIDKYETQFAMQILRDQINQWVFPVHRLDKPTSGVLLFALSDTAARDIQLTWQEKNVTKTYLAVVRGWLNTATDVDHPLKEILDKYTDKKAKKDKPPQEAQSLFIPLNNIELEVANDRFKTSRYSLVKCLPKTGRKHQLRRHLKHLSHPIIGDAKFGKSLHNRIFSEQLNCNRLLLHAASLEFYHPYTNKSVSIFAEFDQTMSQLFEKFQWPSSVSELLNNHYAS